VYIQRQCSRYARVRVRKNTSGGSAIAGGWVVLDVVAAREKHEKKNRQELEIRRRWGGGAKTVKDGQFFLFDHLSSPIVVKGLLPTNNKH